LVQQTYLSNSLLAVYEKAQGWALFLHTGTLSIWWRHNEAGR